MTQIHSRSRFVWFPIENMPVCDFHLHKTAIVNSILAFYLPKVRYLFVLLVFFAEVHCVWKQSMCILFVNNALQQLHNILKQFGDSIKTACQQRDAVSAKLFENSYLVFSFNYKCVLTGYSMIYIVPYLQCSCFISLLLLHLVVNVISVSCLCLCGYFVSFADSLYASHILCCMHNFRCVWLQCFVCFFFLSHVYK